MNAWAKLYTRARAQHGVLHLTDGEPLGITAAALDARARRESWPRPQTGVVLLPGTALDPLARVSAALRAVGTPAFAARRTAAYLHGAIDLPPGTVELLLPHDRRMVTRLRGTRVSRTRTLRREHISTVQRLPVTTVARSLVDLAPLLSTEQLHDLVIDALQRRLLRLDQLRALLDDLPYAPGRSKLRRVIGWLRSERPDSSLERQTRALLRARGFRPHPRPFPFRCSDGVVIHLDVPFPNAWFALECDGREYHTGPRAFETDRIRWGQAQRGGWRLGWVTHHRLRTDPDGIVEEVDAGLAAADPGRPPPPEPDCICARCAA